MNGRVDLQSFEYVKPSSVSEAIKLLEEKGDAAKVLAGGTDLLVQLRGDRYEIDRLVDVKNVSDILYSSLKEGLNDNIYISGEIIKDNISHDKKVSYLDNYHNP